MAEVSFTPDFVLQMALGCYKFNRSLPPERFDDGAKAVDKMARRVLTTALWFPGQYECAPAVLSKIATDIYKLHRRDRVVRQPADLPVGLDAAELELDEAAKEFLEAFLRVGQPQDPNSH